MAYKIIASQCTACGACEFECPTARDQVQERHLRHRRQDLHRMRGAFRHAAMQRGLPGAEDLREGLTAVAVMAGGASADEDDGPFDWLGNPVSCADCPHEDTRAAGRCEFGRICVMDRRARRIDRFFAANPAHAERHLDHPYFEVRTLAARYAIVFPPDARCSTTRSRTSAPWSPCGCRSRACAR